MDEKGVDIFFGTMERPAEALVDTILQDEKSGKYVKGVGFQWAGKDALPGISRRYPDLKYYQTEQECGNGKNDWKGAMQAWNSMKHYLNNGVSMYEYWNISMSEGGISRWGWAQNSLIVVDPEAKTFRYTYEYYILKHVSHYVQPGARKLETVGEYKDVLVFLNPDNCIVVVAANQNAEDRSINLKISDSVYTIGLKANSINTFLIGQ
jgi:glucosylceramidase